MRRQGEANGFDDQASRIGMRAVGGPTGCGRGVGHPLISVIHHGRPTSRGRIEASDVPDGDVGMAFGTSLAKLQ